MKAVVVNFRGGKHTQKNNQLVLIVHGIDTKEKAAELVGKKVTWKSPAGKELVGEVTAAHGNSGAVRARFDTGMPGQAVGKEVEVN